MITNVQIKNCSLVCKLKGKIVWVSKIKYVSRPVRKLKISLFNNKNQI